MDRIDFRSDTVTWPTPAMREAMVRAPLGDDVYGEDPTVNELEAVSAARMGKEAALFVASGNMGNLVAILSHAGRGDEAIGGADSHVFLGEAGGMAVLGGVVPCPLPTGADGRMDPARVEASVRPDDPHLPTTRLVLVENSYAARNGYPLPPDYFASIAGVARKHGLAVHLDGARLFHAAVALAVESAELARHADTVSFCLSKGLCAPVGSVLCGPREFIHRARRVRKLVGGGMRQAGVLAAAGLVALDQMVDRLAEDHADARTLAEGLAEIPEIQVDPASVRTNMVFFDLTPEVPLGPQEVVARLREEFGIWLNAEGGARTLRAVTHYYVGPAEVRALLKALAEVLL